MQRLEIIREEIIMMQIISISDKVNENMRIFMTKCVNLNVHLMYCGSAFLRLYHTLGLVLHISQWRKKGDKNGCG